MRVYTSMLYREVYTQLAFNKDWCGWKLDRISPSDFRRAVDKTYKKLVTDSLPSLPKRAETDTWRTFAITRAS